MNKSQGGTRLFAQSEWCSAESLCGTEADIIGHPVMAEAFDRVMSAFTPKHRVAVLSLCTKTRPYSRTRVWSELITTCGDKADLIATSNGGIIPLEFESEWPYMTYDAPIGDQTYNDLAVETLTARMIRFLTTHRYDKVIYLYLPHYRYRRVPQPVFEATGIPFDLHPTRYLWHRLNSHRRSKKGRSIPRFKVEGFTWYKMAHPEVMTGVRSSIERETS